MQSVVAVEKKLFIPPPGGGGVLGVYMTGRSDVFFSVENLHPQYFLGQEICHVFF